MTSFPPSDGTNSGISGNTFAGPTAIQAAGPHSIQNNYFGGARRYILDEYPIAPSQLDDARLKWLMRQPSRLLDVRSQIVPFVGRDSELRQLTDWRNSASARLSVLLLHAPGGQGKTRLAAEFAQQCRSPDLPETQQWQVLQAGFGPATTGSASTESDPVHNDAAGVLLIVDYADRWAHSELERLLSDPVLHQPRPTRVLLLGRTVRWYAALRGDVADLRAEADDMLLPPLAADRHTMFAAARDRFSAPDLYDLTDAGAITAPGSLDDPDFGLTLNVHMAALVAVEAHRRGDAPPTEPHELSAYLLDREYRAWQRLSEAGVQGQDFRTRPAIMARMVFVATLTGAVDHEAGTRAVQRLDLPGHPDELLLDHRFCYPPTDRARWLEPLYPDRLAEDFIALSTPGHNISAYDPDPWAKDVPAALLTDAEELRSIVADRAVTFLAAAADRWPHVGAKVLFPLLRANPALAVEAGSAALTGLAAIADLPDDILTSIKEILPSGRHVNLDIGAAAIVSAAASRALPLADDPAEQADIHASLSYRLSAVGRHDESLEHSGRAVELCRQLVAAKRLGARDELARSLIVYAQDLAAVGRYDEALRHAREAISFLPDPSSPDAVERALEDAVVGVLVGKNFWGEDLARAMDEFARRLTQVGQRTEALAFSQCAVDTYKAVTESGFECDTAGWAAALDHHAGCLRQSGNSAEALSVSGQALKLRTALAESDRPAYLPDLATSVHNHAARLAEVGRVKEAIEYSKRAVALRNELVEANREAYLADLASSNMNYAARLLQAQLSTEAVMIAQQAVDQYQEVAATALSAHLQKFVSALTIYSASLIEVGRIAEALACADRTVAIFEELSPRDRAVHLNSYAATLWNHVQLLDRLHRPDDALSWSEKAVQLREEVARNTGDPASRSELIDALYEHAIRLNQAGRPADALAFSERAVTLERNWN